jgi:hypothetical protein
MTNVMFLKMITSHIIKTLQGILSISTDAYATSIQINHFCNYKCDYLPWHLVNMTCNCINEYKVVCSYICNLYLQLMLIWMKMTMKNTIISSTFNGI